MRSRVRRGRVRIDAGTVVKADIVVVRPPTEIAKDCVIGLNMHFGPFTPIGDWSRVVGADIGAQSSSATA